VQYRFCDDDDDPLGAPPPKGEKTHRAKFHAIGATVAKINQKKVKKVTKKMDRKQMYGR